MLAYMNFGWMDRAIQDLLKLYRWPPDVEGFLLKAQRSAVREAITGVRKNLEQASEIVQFDRERFSSEQYRRLRFLYDRPPKGFDGPRVITAQEFDVDGVRVPPNSMVYFDMWEETARISIPIGVGSYSINVAITPAVHTALLGERR